MALLLYVIWTTNPGLFVPALVVSVWKSESLEIAEENERVELTLKRPPTEWRLRKNCRQTAWREEWDERSEEDAGHSKWVKYIFLARRPSGHIPLQPPTTIPPCTKTRLGAHHTRDTSEQSCSPAYFSVWNMVRIILFDSPLPPKPPPSTSNSSLWFLYFFITLVWIKPPNTVQISQTGYYSTQTETHCFLKNIRRLMDNQGYVGAVFLDLKQTCDTIMSKLFVERI